MQRYRIRVVGGSCGQGLIRITERLREWINDELGYDCRIDHVNVWESPAEVPEADLILQTLPAFTSRDTDIPIIPVKWLLADSDHRPTRSKILDRLRTDLGEPPSGLPAWVSEASEPPLRMCP